MKEFQHCSPLGKLYKFRQVLAALLFALFDPARGSPTARSLSIRQRRLEAELSTIAHVRT